MTRDAFDIAYAAHTASCTFLLDAAGICRRVVMASAKRPNEGKPLGRCVGAQYVASLDGRIAGGLVELPRVGASMLFARVDEQTGRVSLVRTGVVTKFESRAARRSKPTHDPFAQTDGVRTSAPELAMTAPKTAASQPSSSPSPRASRPDFGPPPTLDERTPATLRRPDLDTSDEDKTQRMQAVRRSDPALEQQLMEKTVADEEAFEVDVDDLATAEYPSAPPSSGPALGERPNLPSSVAPPAPPTLRRPPRPSVPSSDEVVIAVPRPRGRRRSEGSLRAVPIAHAAHATVVTSAPEIPEAPRSDLKLASRRRG